MYDDSINQDLKTEVARILHLRGIPYSAYIEDALDEFLVVVEEENLDDDDDLDAVDDPSYEHEVELD